jgi:hypothetical protein
MGLSSDIMPKRNNCKEWSQFKKRKLSEVPMMVAWIKGDQEVEINFSVIPFHTRFLNIQQGPESGTGLMVDQEEEEWKTKHTHQVCLSEGPNTAEMA